MSEPEQRIVVTQNGPYVVHGNVPLVRKRKVVHADGRPPTWEQTEMFETDGTYALCRCGQSRNKPFCDSSHLRVRFDDSRSSAARQRKRRIVLEDDGIVLRRDRSLCTHAGFCGRVRQIQASMAAGDGDVREQVEDLVAHCPSASYTYALDEDGPDVEPELPRAIAVTSADEPLAGPLWVTGRLPIVRSDGAPFETYNRVTLCRCGQSKTKPLCDGTHLDVEFRE